MPKALKKLKEETVSALPAIIYFLILFNLVHFLGNLARQPGDIQYFSYLNVTLGALIVGKVLVIVNCFSFINAFPKRPMIYNILWKLFIYMLFLNIIAMLHIIFHLMWEDKGFLFALNRFLQDLRLPIFWSVEILLALSFFGYILFAEFARVLGKAEMIYLLFGKKGPHHKIPFSKS